MFPRSRNHVVQIAIAIVAVHFPPFAAAEEASRTSLETRFLSSQGELLPADWHASQDSLTFFVVHGFQGCGTDAECLRQAAAITHRFPGANAIIVDWCPPPRDTPADKPADSLVGQLFGESLIGALAKWSNIPSEYARWVKHVRNVGRDIGEWMVERKISPRNTVICGHSLGAQVGAFASNETAKKELFGETVRTILASDPAGPLFRTNDPSERLDKTDARTVVVVHTTELFGDEHPIGTADIYVSWPESKEDLPDCIWRHSQARELLTASFLNPEMTNSDGTPFGANAFGLEFAELGTHAFHADSTTPTALATATAASPGQLGRNTREQFRN